MPNRLHIRLRVPFPSSNGNWEGTWMIFTHWLPLESEDFISIDVDGLPLKIWFDMRCWRGYETKSEVYRHVNVLTHSIIVDTSLEGVSDDVAKFFLRKVGETIQSSKETELEFNRIRHLALTAALKGLNRLIAYARYYKGQYWLKEFSFDRKDRINLPKGFRAGAQLEGMPEEGNVWINASWSEEPFPIEDDRYISSKDWANANEFVRTERRPPLVLELLANAESLVVAGYRRSALIEAVVALEVSLTAFCRNPSPKLFGIANNRVDSSSLKSLFEKIGTRGFVKLLLPILISETDMSLSIIKACQSAIDLRNNIVHNGQRGVTYKETVASIQAIRSACITLQNFTTQGMNVP